MVHAGEIRTVLDQLTGVSLGPWNKVHELAPTLRFNCRTFVEVCHAIPADLSFAARHAAGSRCASASEQWSNEPAVL